MHTAYKPTWLFPHGPLSASRSCWVSSRILDIRSDKLDRHKCALYTSSLSPHWPLWFSKSFLQCGVWISPLKMHMTKVSSYQPGFKFIRLIIRWSHCSQPTSSPFPDTFHLQTAMRDSPQQTARKGWRYWLWSQVTGGRVCQTLGGFFLLFSTLA